MNTKSLTSRQRKLLKRALRRLRRCLDGTRRHFRAQLTYARTYNHIMLPSRWIDGITLKPIDYEARVAGQQDEVAS